VRRGAAAEPGGSEPLDWGSTLVDGDPVAYVKTLAQTAEGRVTVTGGVQTVRSLFVGGPSTRSP
jgi:hypothetical protein